MKKIVVLLMTIFVISMCASVPLRFKAISVEVTGLNAIKMTFEVEGGTPKYTYTLQGQPVQGPVGTASAAFGPSIPITSEEKLTFSVVDGSGSVISGAIGFSVEQFFRIGSSITIDFTHPSCIESLDGVIRIASVGGYGTYSVNSTIQDSCSDKSTCLFVGTFSGRVAVEVSGVLGDDPDSLCLVKLDIIPTDVPLELSVKALDAKHGLDNGSIVIKSLTGNNGPPYTVKLTGEVDKTIMFPEDTIFSNLPAGDYKVVAQSPGFCTSVETPIVVTVLPTSIVSSLKIINPKCNGDASGEITVKATSNYPPLEYSLNNGTFTKNNVFKGLSAGKYVVLIKDDADFTAQDIVTLTNSSDLRLFTVANEADYGDDNGLIVVLAAGGTPWYRFSLDGGDLQYSPVFMDLAAGQYKIEVIDVNGCIAETTAEVVDKNNN